MNNSQQRGTAGRSQVRRAELIATGRKLFADTSYDALSMDDIARQAGVAKGLIYYYFKSKRGYYLAIVEDSVAELVARAVGEPDLPNAERVRRTIEGYLYYAEHHQAAYRTIVTGGVGSDAEVLAIRDTVREELVAAIAEGAYGRPTVPPIARLALVGWLSGVEGATLEWIGTLAADPTGEEQPDRARLGALLVRQLRATLTVIGEFVPECPAPPVPEGSSDQVDDLVPVTGSP
ncbi:MULTISPECIES: TetR/AcrR family transcriptional regulator [unclassified Streptomyces]|uniref:TetR/AcrR family transcriptional regulator n=1 Tax=unclassified Streptomyces TaxID=2593676 RepID=UPI001BE763AA|nr:MULTISPECIES: TetR/AcrR family transcriptional regulator [unclassified Streptomyces]MBT2407288.1 TetR/AcrR family transcriptional regulator [Streptomyces sp. ISL-21]MBT2459409.1 TetR/AcrR family transcriptional regulator [Streptomyces sp. ISL-86]MBT2613415.1 TetR/AcrR family transcriptional regulator [Streptomyces sp. ISL-87]